MSVPEGWASASLAELADSKGGGTPPTADSTYWGGLLPWVSPKDMKSSRIRDSIDHVTERALERQALIPSGSVVVVVRSGILSRTLPVAVTDVPVVLNQDMRAFVPAPGIAPDFLAWQLIASTHEILHRCTKDGTTVASVEGSKLAAFGLRVAPSAEQRRIVEKLDELLSDLDAATAELHAAKRKLTLYRQSLLKSAVDGSLMAGWRGGNQRAEPRTDADLPTLPKGWHWSNLGAEARIQGGIQKQPSRAPAVNRFPFLRVANVLRGKLRLDDVHEIELFGDEIERFRLLPDDLLIVEGNGSLTEIGRCARWDGSIPDTVHQNHLIRARPLSMSSAFVEAWLNSPWGIALLTRLAATTSGLYTLSVSKLSRLPVPVPSRGEQDAIVGLLVQQAVGIGVHEAAIDHALAMLAAQRQNILRAAFSGRLVPQDPNDEPASVLLERIRAARDQAPKRSDRSASARKRKAAA